MERMKNIEGIMKTKIMKGIYVEYYILIILLFASCLKNKNSDDENVTDIRLSKLEQLMLIPQDSVLDYLDLSNDSILEIPDLSSFRIRSLNLSYNKIDTLIVTSLPKDIEELDVSHNCLKSILYISHNDIPTLKRLDLSDNQLEEFESSCSLLNKLDLSNNNLIKISLIDGNLEYIDISSNPRLSNIVDFPHQYIDTVICHNIANDEPVVSRFELPFIVE